MLWAACFFCLSNLTTDPVFKHIKNQTSKNGNNYVNIITNDLKNPKLLSTFDILKDFDLTLLIATEGILAYLFFQMDLVFNMVAIFNFHWKMASLSIALIVAVVLTIFLISYVRSQIVSCQVNIFYLFVMCCVLLLFSQSLMHLTISLELNQHFCIQFFLFQVAIVCLMVYAFGSTAYARWLLFELSPSHSASIVESHRFLFSKLFSFLGFNSRLRDAKPLVYIATLHCHIILRDNFTSLQ